MLLHTLLLFQNHAGTVYLFKIITAAQHSTRQGLMDMKINKKYRNLMQQKCKSYYNLEDFKIVYFKFGKRVVPIFYVPLYGGEDKKEK